VRPGETFYNNEVQRTNTGHHSFNVDFFFSNDSCKENMLWKQSIFFTLFPLVLFLNVVVADHKAAVMEVKVHTGIYF